MSFVTTPLFTDTFQRANESPLNPANWHTVGAGLPTTDQLEVLNNKCASTIVVQDDGQASVSSVVFPNDQYCECKLTNLTINGAVDLYLRAGVDLGPNYDLFIVGPFNDNTGQSAYGISQTSVDGGTTIHDWANFLPLTFQVNDVIRFAVIGAYPTGKLFFFQNNNLIFTGNLGDSPSGIASGTVGLQVAGLGAVTDSEIINFAAGSISQTSAVWSPVDSRTTKPNSATFRIVNGAQIDDVQTSSNHAVPGTDSRKAGAPVASGTSPQNSRTAPPFHG